MALPLGGQLSMSEIAAELGTTGQLSLGEMSRSAGLSAPDAISEFHGYSAVIDIYVASYYSSGAIRNYNVNAPPFPLSSPASISSSYRLYMFNYNYYYGYFSTYTRPPYLFTDPNSLAAPYYPYAPYATYPQYLDSYTNYDENPNDSANIINA